MSKERFEIFGDKLVKDNEQEPNLLNNYLCSVRLNEFVDKISDLEAKLAEKEKENELMAKTLRMTKFIEKEITQDKISFTVEQLNQLRIRIKNRQKDWNTGVDYEFTDLLPDYDIYEEIDNQIKQLKEMK